ncbi:MAG: histidine phosphatase family protein [Gracilimonas sp.]|nr:histidine phosphatase family protein [Gracilimonas sp.]
MKTILFVALSLLISVGATAQNTDSQISEDETLLIFTRHAEKIKTDDPDPSLNASGKKRAYKLLTLLRHYDTIEAIYSTNYNRTRETAQPAAEHFELPIRIYNPKELKIFKDQIIENHVGQTVLIVGHSNTTPALINLVLGEERIDQFDENDYSNMYIIRMKEGEAPFIKHYLY